MDELEKVKDRLHMLNCYVYATCESEVEAIIKKGVSDKEIIDNLFERISCVALDDLFYNLCYRLINYVETYDRYLGSEYRTKLKIYMNYQLEHR